MPQVDDVVQDLVDESHRDCDQLRRAVTAANSRACGPSPRPSPATTADCSQCHTTKTFDASRPRSATICRIPSLRRGSPTPLLPRTAGTQCLPARVTTPSSGIAAGSTVPAVAGQTHVRLVPACARPATTVRRRPAARRNTSRRCSRATRATGRPRGFRRTSRTRQLPRTLRDVPQRCRRDRQARQPLRDDARMRLLPPRQAWRPTCRIAHLSAVLDARPGVACIACHAGNSELVVWRYPNLKPDCGGCHGPDFRGGRQPRPAPGVGPGLQRHVH